MPTSSTRPGLGALPFAGGTTFRVWAPNAKRVRVAGDFTSWAASPLEMASENNGYWSLDVAGVAPGAQYKFILDDVWKIDPRVRQVTNSVGDGIVTSPDFDWQINDFHAPPWNKLVIYEMHLATFPDEPQKSKDLFEAAAKDFWYLQQLGINAIHLLPAAEFPGDQSWGYNPSHIFSVESSYGGPEALKTFIDKAHAAGLAVIIDVVYNHLGPSDLAIWQFDGWSENGGGGIYFYNDWRARTPWGHTRPDYGRPEVREFLRDNALMWLEEFRADGLRFDMTVFVRNVDGSPNDPPDDPKNLGGWGWNILRWINDEINARQPWKITIAEDLQNTAEITASTSVGGAGLDSQWDAGFFHPVRRVLTQMADDDRDMGAIKAAIEHRYNGDAFQRTIYTESHDEVAASNGKRRLTEDIQPGHADGWFSKKRSTLGAALVFTSPGIPMIFQGQEILEWLPFADQNRVDWDKWDEDRFRGIWQLYGDLARLRRNWYNNTRGLHGQGVNVFLAGSDKVIAFHRWDQGGAGDDVVVVLNFANRAYDNYTLGFPRAGQWWVRFNSDWKGYNPEFGNHPCFDTVAGGDGAQGMPYSGNIGLGPYTALILSQ